MLFVRGVGEGILGAHQPIRANAPTAAPRTPVHFLFARILALLHVSALARPGSTTSRPTRES
jgi:hypothetical protein